MNKDIMIAAGFGAEVALVVAGQCPFCQMPINDSDFKDELSRKEFQISGLCQSCQDEVCAEDDTVTEINNTRGHVITETETEVVT